MLKGEFKDLPTLLEKLKQVNPLWRMRHLVKLRAILNKLPKQPTTTIDDPETYEFLKQGVIALRHGLENNLYAKGSRELFNNLDHLIVLYGKIDNPYWIP